jgi:peptide/nickel transport system permease protein
MSRYILRRILLMFPVLLGTALLVFVASRTVVPGDPVLMWLEEDYTAQEYADMKAYLGLDQPIYIQFAKYLNRIVLHGDLGYSYLTEKPVAKAITERLGATFILAGVSLVIGLVIAIPVGIISAIKPYSKFYEISMVTSLAAVSVPPFWEGIMLILVFSYYLDWLPVAGRGMPPDAVHLILPAFTLGTHHMATTLRLTRSCMLEVLGEDYIRTARAKGLREIVVFVKHAFRNALIPVVTDIGLTMGRLVGGSVVVEVVFGWPGLGKLSYDAIVMRDFPILQGIVLYVASIFVGVNLLIDFLYTILDPRIKSV